MNLFGHPSIAGAVAGVCLITPSAALACVIDSQICTTGSTGLFVTYMTPNAETIDPSKGSFVVLQATKAADADDDLLLINCPARSAIVITGRQYDVKGYWDAGDIMQAAIDSPKRESFREVRNRLKAAGYASAIRPIAADHCACDQDRPLPVMGCGDSGP